MSGFAKTKKTGTFFNVPIVLKKNLLGVILGELRGR
jgi:hypothetical protein